MSNKVVINEAFVKKSKNEDFLYDLLDLVADIGNDSYEEFDELAEHVEYAVTETIDGYEEVVGYKNKGNDEIYFDPYYKDDLKEDFEEFCKNQSKKVTPLEIVTQELKDVTKNKQFKFDFLSYDEFDTEDTHQHPVEFSKSEALKILNNLILDKDESVESIYYKIAAQYAGHKEDVKLESKEDFGLEVTDSDVQKFLEFRKLNKTELDNVSDKYVILYDQITSSYYEYPKEFVEKNPQKYKKTETMEGNFFGEVYEIKDALKRKWWNDYRRSDKYKAFLKKYRQESSAYKKAKKKYRELHKNEINEKRRAERQSPEYLAAKAEKQAQRDAIKAQAEILEQQAMRSEKEMARRALFNYRIAANQADQLYKRMRERYRLENMNSPSKRAANLTFDFRSKPSYIPEEQISQLGVSSEVLREYSPQSINIIRDVPDIHERFYDTFLKDMSVKATNMISAGDGGYFKREMNNPDNHGMQVVNLKPFKVAKRMMLNRLYLCYMAATYFQILVSNTPIDEDYNYLVPYKVKKRNRIDFYNRDEKGNKISEKTSFNMLSDMNVSVGFSYRRTHHKADKVIVRADWILNFRGKNFKAFKSDPAPNSSQVSVDGVMDEDWFVKKDDFDSMLKIALFLNSNTEPAENEEMTSLNYSAYFNAFNINPRWQQLEYGHYEFAENVAASRVGMNPKYGFLHGLKDGSFTYQAPQGYKRVTDALWNMQLSTGRWAGYASRFLTEHRPKLNVSEINTELFKKLENYDPTLGSKNYELENLYKI